MQKRTRRTNTVIAKSEMRIAKELINQGEYLKAEKRLFGLSQRVFDVVNHTKRFADQFARIERFKDEEYSKYREKMKWNSQSTPDVFYSPLKHQNNPQYAGS